MKLIIAIIQPDKLDEVHEALMEAEITRITVSRVTGHGQAWTRRSTAGEEVVPACFARSASTSASTTIRGHHVDAISSARPSRRRRHRRREDLHPAAGGHDPHPDGRTGRHRDLDPMTVRPPRCSRFR